MSTTSTTRWLPSATLPGLATVLLLLCGCTTAVPYRNDTSTLEPRDGHPGGRNVLGHLEFDDMGELHDSTQLATVTSEIQRQSKSRPLLVILFVHGWNNDLSDASRKSGTYARFREMIGKLEDLPNKRAPFGVAVGWRGKTSTLGSFALDYHHRYQGAQRVADVAASGAFYEICHAARKANKENRIIVVGHSFGALIVDHVMSRAIASQVAGAAIEAGAAPVNPTSQVPADLVLLVNEAENGLPARQLLSLFDHWKMNHGVVEAAGKKVDAPWILSVTSESDGATGRMYPFSVGFARNVPPWAPISTASSGVYRAPNGTDHTLGSQREAHWNTIGHIQSLHSHELVEHPKTNRSARPGLRNLWNANERPALDADGGFSVVTTKGTYCFMRKEGAWNQTPYWIMRVPNHIIQGHSEIWGDDFVALVRAVLQLRREPMVPVTPAQKERRAERPMLQLQAF